MSYLLYRENNDMVKVISSEDKKEKSRFIVTPWSTDGKGFYVISDLERVGKYGLL
jgi:hypothetical protein